MKMEETQDIDYVTFVIWGTGACGVVVAINVHRMISFLCIAFLNNYLSRSNIIE